jgi:hypothetical protein
MPKTFRPQEIARAFDWDIGDIREFAGNVLEDANDHWTAHALWSMNAGDVDLACEFLQLEAQVETAGELTPELREQSNALLDRFKELQEEEEEENEGEEEDEEGGED